MTNATKKQNRILLGTLVLLCAALITLAAMTSTAQKRAKAQKEGRDPLPESRVSEAESSPEETSKPAGETKAAGKTEDGADGKKEAEPQVLEEQVKTTARDSDKTEGEEDAAVSAIVKAEDMLPVFRRPVEGGVVVKGCSLTVPVYSATMNDYRVHRGLDFAAQPGSPVFASADGTVTEVRRDPMMGMTVSVKHAGGAVTTYKGLDPATADMTDVGDTVRAGQAIGAVGETALIESAEENHLHFEMTVGGKPVDPGDYLEVVYLGDLYED